MKAEFNTKEIINESMGIIFPKKTHTMSFKPKEGYDVETKNKLVQLECAIGAVQDMMAQNQNVVAGNYSQFDAILDRLYSLIREVEMIKQNGK
jgi:hypothetical protein